jgi:hypothetical protein
MIATMREAESGARRSATTLRGIDAVRSVWTSFFEMFDGRQTFMAAKLDRAATLAALADHVAGQR